MLLVCGLWIHFTFNSSCFLLLLPLFFPRRERRVEGIPGPIVVFWSEISPFNAGRLNVGSRRTTPPFFYFFQFDYGGALRPILDNFVASPLFFAVPLPESPNPLCQIPSRLWLSPSGTFFYGQFCPRLMVLSLHNVFPSRSTRLLESASSDYGEIFPFLPMAPLPPICLGSGDLRIPFDRQFFPTPFSAPLASKNLITCPASILPIIIFP